MTEFASSSAARPIDRVAHDAQCSSRLLKEDVPGSRQLYSACCSLKQLYADLCFQLADTDRKFNRMRPSMARVLGLETRSAKEG